MYVHFKRIFDVIVATILLVLLALPMCIIAILIKLQDDGPVIFKQDRMGKDLKPFKMYKFRSMRIDRKELDGKMTHEQMVTKIGKFIRKTSLDELPQLINIIKGEMAFIGPRPWIPEYYKWFNEEQLRRAEVLPGLSGLAQVKGRNGISVMDKLNYDIFYVDNIGLKLDLKIWGMTIKAMFEKKNAEISEIGIVNELEQLKYYNKTLKKNAIRSM